MPRSISHIGTTLRTAGRRLRPYRPLLIVYGLAIAIGAWEVSQRGEAVDLFLDADANYTDALLTLYPDRGESHYAKALQAILCSEAEDQHRPVPATCQQYNSRELIRESDINSTWDCGRGSSMSRECITNTYSSWCSRRPSRRRSNERIKPGVATFPYPVYRIRAGTGVDGNRLTNQVTH